MSIASQDLDTPMSTEPLHRLWTLLAWIRKLGHGPRFESAWLSRALVPWILIQPTITAGVGTGVEVGTLLALLVFLKTLVVEFMPS